MLLIDHAEGVQHFMIKCLDHPFEESLEIWRAWGSLLDYATSRTEYHIEYVGMFPVLVAL